MIKDNSRGFTLIEVVVSLVIMGIVAVVAGMGLIQGVQAYVTTKLNSETLQRAEYALNRIKLELITMDSVTAANGSSITFTCDKTDRGTAKGTVYVISHTGTQINLSVDGAANPLLTGLAASNPFLTYRNNAGGAWILSQGFETLHHIEIRLLIPRPDGGEAFTFTTSVNPRNNGLANVPERTESLQ